MSILAYVVRHGETDKSPEPEWWSQIPVNALGESQARSAGKFILEQKKQPTWGVSSDLKRAIQTLAICAEVVKITNIVRPMVDLRALGKNEDQKAFEKRNERAFTAILATAKVKGEIPLIACHRSNTAYIAKRFANVLQSIDYRVASMVSEGGVIELNTRGAKPIYRPVISENPKSSLSMPDDGTPISGFVTAQDNRPPRECGNCKWMETDHCEHPVVTADDALHIFYERKRNAAGYWVVESDDCCDSFQHKIIALTS